MPQTLQRYRGTRDGFMYRNGPWGRGYYSKDIVRSGLIHTVPSDQEYASEGERASHSPAGFEKQSVDESLQHSEKPKGAPLYSSAEAGGGANGKKQEEGMTFGIPKNRVQKREIIGQMLSAPPAVRCVELSDDGCILYTGKAKANCSTKFACHTQFNSRKGIPLL